MRQFPAE